MKRAYRDGDRTREVEIRRVGESEFEAVVDGEPLRLRVTPLGDGFLRLETANGPLATCVTRDGKRRFVTLGDRDYVLEEAPASARRTRTARAEHASGEISMPMPGLVVRVDVREGDQVNRGQVLLVVEAMKMEHTLRAPRDGIVAQLAAEPGKMIDAGAVLLQVRSA